MIWLRSPSVFLLGYARSIAAQNAAWTVRLVALVRVVHLLAKQADTQAEAVRASGLSLRTVRGRWLEAQAAITSPPKLDRADHIGGELWIWWRSLCADPAVVPVARLVALMIGTCCRFGGTGYRSHAWVANASGVSLRTAGRALRDLETAGWLSVTRRKGPSSYRLTWPTGWSDRPAPGTADLQEGVFSSGISSSKLDPPLDLGSSSQIRISSAARSRNLSRRTRARLVATGSGEIMQHDDEDTIPPPEANARPRLALVPPPARHAAASGQGGALSRDLPQGESARPGRPGPEADPNGDTDRAPPELEESTADMAARWLRDPHFARAALPNPAEWPEVRAVLEAEARAFRNPWAARAPRQTRMAWGQDTKIVRIVEALAQGYSPEELAWAFEAAKAERFTQQNARFLNAADILARLERVPALIAAGVQLEIARHRARLEELKASEGRRYLDRQRAELENAERERLRARVAELEALIGGAP